MNEDIIIKLINEVDLREGELLDEVECLNRDFETCQNYNIRLDILVKVNDKLSRVNELNRLHKILNRIYRNEIEKR